MKVEKRLYYVVSLEASASMTLNILHAFGTTFLRTMALVVVDETVRRAIVGCHVAFSSQLGQDCFRQRLAQLYSPLIEGIDIPNGSLREDLHLIQGNQATERSRS